MNNFVLKGMSLDSRLVKSGDLFFALPGEKQHGQAFISEAIARGAAAVMTETFMDSAKSSHRSNRQSEVPVIEYSHLINAVGFMASRFYDNPSHTLPIIGITGTNGKTSCSHIIAQLSSFFSEPCAVVGTLGVGFLENLSDFGLTTPDVISLHRWLAELKKEGAKRVAMEVSSHALVQKRVSGVHFHTAVFTNLTRDHLDYHKDLEDYFQAKVCLFTECKPKHVVLNVDDAYGQRLLGLLLRSQHLEETSGREGREGTTPVIIAITTEAALPPAVLALTKHNTQHHWRIHAVTTHHLKMSNQGIEAEIQSPWGSGSLRCSLMGQFNLSNVLSAMAVLCLQDEEDGRETIEATEHTLQAKKPIRPKQAYFSKLLAAASQLKPVAGRMNRLGGGENGPTIIIDYAHTPDALAKVLMALRPYCAGKLWCVFGCGGDRDPGKRPLMAAVAEEWSDHIIVTQDNPRTENVGKIIEEILKGFSKSSSKNIRVESDRAKAIEYSITEAKPEDMILIAGKGHEAYQVIQTERIPFLDENHARAALARRKA